METLREIFIKLGLSVNAAEFAEGLAWEHALEKGAEMLKDAFEEVPKILIESIGKTAEFGEQMQLLSIKTGASAEEIQKLGYAASLNGSSAEAMGTALQRLARQMEEAKDGSEASQKHFSKLGISMAEVRSQTPDELFKTIAEKLKNLGDSGKASAIAMQLFGRQGKDLVPTLLEGREGLEEMGRELDDLGGLMGNDSIKAAREYEDSMKKLHAVSEGLTHQLGSVLIEALQPIVTGILDWVKANRQLIGQNLQSFAKAVASGITLVGKGIIFVMEHLDGFIKLAKFGAMVLGSTLAVLAAEYAATGLAAAWAGIAAAAAWALAVAPLALVVGVLVLAALMAEDLYYFLTDGDSVIGKVLEHLGQLVKEVFTNKVQEWYVNSWLRTALDLAEQFLNVMASLDRTGLTRFMFDKAKEKGAAMATPTGSVEDMNAQIAAAMVGAHGASASPSASAEAARGGSSTVNGGTLAMPVTIVQGAGQSAGSVVDELGAYLERFWDSKMRSVVPVPAT